MKHDVEFRAAPPKAILLVEDDAPDQKLVEQKVLSLWPKCNITSVPSLYEAYKEFRVNNFDMVILDLNLPDAIGPKTVGEMRKFNRSTPIIVLTGMLNSITKDEALKLGANSIYPKAKIMDEDFLEILEKNITT